LQERKHSRDDQSKWRDREVGEGQWKSLRTGSAGADGDVDGWGVGGLLRLSGRKDIVNAGEEGGWCVGCELNELAVAGGFGRKVDRSWSEPEEADLAG